MDVLQAMFGWDQGLSLLAPLVAIVTALVTRRVLVSLGAGVVVAGVVAAHGVLLGPEGLSCLAVCGTAGPCPDDAGAICRVAGYVAQTVFDTDKITITTFTVLVAAMVGVMEASGATRTLVGAVERFAAGPRGAMLASWIAGFVVFFDDYANCLVVGSAMGPVCDRNGVSRAKLAYIVDSTAAPVASLAVVGTWVGFEVGLIDQSLQAAGHGAGEGFGLFVAALPYRFYGIFALALVGLLAWTGRDFGPMLEVERQARRAHAARASEPAAPAEGWARVALSALPVVALVVVTFGVMVRDGIAALPGPVSDAPLYEILGGADAYKAMLYGALVGWGLASALGLGLARMPLGDWARGTGRGVVNVLQALGILYLAWALGTAIGDTAARDFLLGALGAWFPVALLPSVVFLLASVIAFATGTSFGTMSILVPLAVPLAVGMGHDAMTVVAGTTAAVLAGACLGDHASPISDTTVLSAAGSGCELVEHVRTQLPYALLAGLVSLVVGYLPAGVGVPPWLTLPLGLAVLWFVVIRFGQPTVEAA
ncbi:MAG: Na+/H+ antiporter NhaC family protein [Alphaproteobacteria bacterium]|nr:Na+/H+ antiporter NhaC family protein [Alphaproteobacteria bacterium]